MLNSNLLQLLVFPFGVLYLLLHAGPLVRVVYAPSIRGGTRWQFFGSEVVLFTAWLLCAPAVWQSSLGRIALAAHLSMHVVFTATDYFAHSFLLSSALTKRQRNPLMWFAKESGLVLDTLTHAIVVAIAARALGLVTAVALTIPAVAVFALVTRWYIRNFSQPEPCEANA